MHPFTRSRDEFFFGGEASVTLSIIIIIRKRRCGFMIAKFTDCTRNACYPISTLFGYTWSRNISLD